MDTGATVKLNRDFFTAGRVGTRNPCIVQGSTVIKVYKIIK